MKFVELAAAVTALVTAATPAFAVDWIYIGTNVNGIVIHYDGDTIQRSRDQITVWEKWETPQNKTAKFRERKIRYRYDCAERTRTLLNGIAYYPDGTNQSFNYEAWQQEAEPIAPDTSSEATMEAVCAAKAPL